MKPSDDSPSVPRHPTAPASRRAWRILFVPLWCFAVVATPNLLAELHDAPSSLPLRALKLVFAFSLLSLPWVVFPPRWLMWASVPLSVLAFLENIHILTMNEPSSIGVIHSLLVTNFREASEFAERDFARIAVLGCIPLLTAILVHASRRQAIPVPAPRNRMILGAVFAIGIATEPIHILWHFRHEQRFEFTLWHMKEGFHRTFPVGTVWKISEVASRQVSLHRRLAKVQDFQWNPVAVAPSPLPETYVVVIGEASRSGNWGIYGYPRPTTPLLQSDTDIIVYSNTTSGANITTLAIPPLLTTATPSNPDSFDQAASILSCFRQAGFKTWWLSNQGQFSIWDGYPTKISREASSYWFAGGYSGSSSLDTILLPALDKALSDPASKKLIVLHTFGSHVRYAERCPSKFKLFPSQDGGNGIGDYDNSILFTDWFVVQTLDRIRSRGGIAALAYISDHGEALGEGGKHIHGNPEPVRAEFEVPLLFWLSPDHLRRRADVRSELLAHRNLRTSASDFPATLLEIAGIRSALTDSTRNLARPTFREHTRWAVTPNLKIVDVDTLKGSSLPRRGSPPSVP